MARSRHTWDFLSLPAHKSSRHIWNSTLWFAEEVIQRLAKGGDGGKGGTSEGKVGANRNKDSKKGTGAKDEPYDLILCSDMLNLAEFRGLVPEPIRSLPAVVYLIENQLTCPIRFESERDWHYAYSNLTTALSADRLWFNSAFHREDFLNRLPEFMRQLPQELPANLIGRIAEKSSVWYTGIEAQPARGPRPPGPMRILWVARWEHMQNPETFFEALKVLKWHGAEFRLSVLGQQFLEHPPAFDWARQYFYYHIDWWGYQANRRDYEDALAEADVVVSTADYEFWGLSLVETIAAGALPIIPDRLSYPEVLSLAENPNEAKDFFYSGSVQELATRLIHLADRTRRNDLWHGDPEKARRLVQRFYWENLVPKMDDELAVIADKPRG
ncbi:MAG: DUF3524 domain-containing protein [Phycisphaerae bacterium]|nr:DUF3524 domain-containing protein [Phycisphaerae bacterium]